MKRLLNHLIVLIIALVFIGCSGLQISDSASDKTIAYVAGKGIGFSVNDLYPQLDAELSATWVEMMEAHKNNSVSSYDYFLDWYNSTIQVIALEFNDPYGIVSDIATLMALFGAEYNDQGELINIQEIPYETLLYFEMGYQSGRSLALTEREIKGP